MTLTTPFKRGFTFYPFIFIPKRLEKGTAWYESYASHETVHYKRQGLLAIFWVIRYFLSKKFRWQEEKLAYTAEIEYLKERGIQIDEQSYIDSLVNEYWNMVDRKTATSFIDDLVKESKL